ncbi:uncharacterized protein L203_101202 [Cryptococcus depauperatus CBS 7841]|uniref:Uncharacterized protein n=1 Tax=Cryptococcus depauperatus CBS 7841 TaxID=1295531 RepID=A0AAJ8JPM6_9TREE
MSDASCPLPLFSGYRMVALDGHKKALVDKASNGCSERQDERIGYYGGSREAGHQELGESIVCALAEVAGFDWMIEVWANVFGG